MSAKRKPKPQEKCPMCGLERDEGEATYMCVGCGSEGFDCCVPGNNAICFDCEKKDDDEYAHSIAGATGERQVSDKPEGGIFKELLEHEKNCATCTAAKKRVNDLCLEGRYLFAKCTTGVKPTRIEEVELTDEQYERLVADQRRAKKAGGN